MACPHNGTAVILQLAINNVLVHSLHTGRCVMRDHTPSDEFGSADFVQDEEKVQNAERCVNGKILSAVDISKATVWVGCVPRGESRVENASQGVCYLPHPGDMIFIAGNVCMHSIHELHTAR